MIARVRIKPEVITEHRLRIEMYGLEDEDIENTVRMKGWAWVRARKCWAYAGEPDFIYRQIREVVIGLPDITFIEEDLEESVKTVERKPAQTRNSKKAASYSGGPSTTPASPKAKSLSGTNKRPALGKILRPAGQERQFVVADVPVE